MTRPDPRAEPTSNPPTSPDPAVERVVVSRIKAKADEAESGVDTGSVEAPNSVTSADPRVAEVEPLVERNDWKGVAKKLGPLADAGKLPPNLGLLAAVAHHELAKEGDERARELAIRCVAGLIGMPADSEIVRVLGRRLLRKNPVRFGQRPAPPARVSAIIVFLVLAVGGGVGWFLSSGASSRLLGRFVHL